MNRGTFGYSKKVALCGMIAALSAVVLLLARFVPADFAMPAVAGVFLVVIVVEFGAKWAFGVFAAVCVLGFLIADPGSWSLYLLFFGYYPILKAVLEKFRSRAAEYAAKLAVFNAAMLLSYLLLTAVFGIPVAGPALFGKYALAALLLIGNAVFIVFDIALTNLISNYIARLQPRISRLLR